jgi:hypothetical protein
VGRKRTHARCNAARQAMQEGEPNFWQARALGAVVCFLCVGGRGVVRCGRGGCVVWGSCWCEFVSVFLIIA